MKNKALIIASAVFLLLASSTVVGYQLIHNQTPEQPSPAKFRLDDDFYTGGQLNELSSTEFEQLIAQQASFVLIAHMEYCPAETPLTTTAEELIHQKNYGLYGLKGDEFKSSSLASTIKYLPSAAIFRDGQLVAYLDAESDADIPYYQSATQLENWLNKYIEL